MYTYINIHLYVPTAKLGNSMSVSRGLKAWLLGRCVRGSRVGTWVVKIPIYVYRDYQYMYIRIHGYILGRCIRGSMVGTWVVKIPIYIESFYLLMYVCICLRIHMYVSIHICI
jgi:hypothetical protein